MSHRSRVIPLLLVTESGLTKTIQFGGRRYIGDPLNAARTFSDLRADELILLDISAGADQRPISTDLVSSIADEITMPLAVGGGIRTTRQVERLITAGAEKVVLGTGAWEDAYLIKEVSDHFGTSAVTVCIDAKLAADGNYRVFANGGGTDTGLSPEEFAYHCEEHGAGEIVIQSIDRDGEMKGYDITLIASVAQKVSIPVVALGGAGSYSDLAKAIDEGGASAAAAGSLFVFRGRNRAVLINYPVVAERKAR